MRDKLGGLVDQIVKGQGKLWEWGQRGLEESMIRSLFDACSVEYRSDHPIAISLTNFNPKYHKVKEEVKEESKDKEERKVVKDALNF